MQSMKELMPVTAAAVEEFRRLVGRELVDAALRRAMRGEGGFWAREEGPDGVVREFGGLPDRTPAPLARQGARR